MGKQETIEHQFMSLRSLNYLLAGVALAAFILLVITSVQISSAYDVMIDASEQYVELQSCAHEMQKASDYLTELARSYVSTGDSLYMDHYFEEVNVTRRREKALAKFEEYAGNADAMMQLSTALEESNRLMQTEFSAMRLTALALKRDFSSLPEPVQNAKLSDAYADLNASTQMKLSKSMMADILYSAKKSAISNALNRCLDILVQTLQEQHTQAGKALNRAFAQRRAVSLILCTVIVSIIVINTRLVINPMLKGVTCIRDGKPLPVEGAYELRFLARTYNDMYRTNEANQKELSYRIMHDPLTGVYNRNGYELYLGDKASLERSALLLVDVDRFKTVNDTYGHSAGDRVLTLIAKVLREHFGDEDAVCRIGGDEFAIFIRNVDAQDKERIAETIHTINELLLHPTDDLPPVSLSAGCSFGDGGVESLSKHADLALYQVKEHGRCGCAFFEPEYIVKSEL